MSEFWNQRFGQDLFVYGQKPNKFFQETLEQISAPGKKLLLPAEGEGRNAMYAARMGWEVHAFDSSETGRKKAMEWASKERLEFTYDLMSYQELKLPALTYDVAALIYAHMPGDIRPMIHKKIVTSLRLGGYIILEAFDKQQLGNDSGGPKNLDMLYDTATLRDDFEGMKFEQLEKIVTTLDEGPYHQGEAVVVRMIATKQP